LSVKWLCFYECADEGCLYDRLTIYNNVGVFENQSQHFVGMYCGTKIPHSMTFKDSVMMIFQTDNYYADNGFEIIYAVTSKKNYFIFEFQNCSFHAYVSMHTQLIF